VSAPRPVEVLVDVDRPAWPWVQGLIEKSELSVEVLPVGPESAQRTLHRLQVTVGSALGAIALHTGGLIIDNWVRLLGGGGALPALGEYEEVGKMTVGYDLLGGRFALNGTALDGPPGGLWYWAPDTLEWESIDSTYSGMLEWFLGGALTKFYADCYWPGWRSEAVRAAPWEGITLFPPPFTKEGTKADQVRRKIVDMSLLLDLYVDTARQLAGKGPDDLVAQAPSARA
jgi:hypothetical protein